MKDYEYIEFEHKNTEVDNSDDWQKVEMSLQVLLDRCEFIVSDFGPLWASDSIKIENRYRGPQLQFKDGGYTWWYNINGGYKLNPFCKVNFVLLRMLRMEKRLRLH